MQNVLHFKYKNIPETLQIIFDILIILTKNKINYKIVWLFNLIFLILYQQCVLHCLCVWGLTKG